MSVGLAQEHLKIVREILATHLPAGMWVRAFGSRAKHSHRFYSDLELAVKGRTLTLSELADLSDAFCESDLPFKVDVVDLTTSDAAFAERVERDAVKL